MDEPDLLTDDVPLDEGLPPTDDTPPAEDLPVTGRHRAAPATVRQVAQRAAVGAGTLVVVAALAVLTAFWTGLTGAPAQIQASTPPMVSAHPTFGRTMDLHATRADRATPSTETPTTVAESPSPSSADPPEPAPTPEPAPKPSPEPPADPAPLPGVQPGDPCATEGARATSAAGKPAVCTARGDGTTRWRHA